MSYAELKDLLAHLRAQEDTARIVGDTNLVRLCLAQQYPIVEAMDAMEQAAAAARTAEQPQHAN